MKPETIRQMESESEALMSQWQGLLNGAKAQRRDLTADEVAASERFEKRIKSLQTAIGDATKFQSLQLPAAPRHAVTTGTAFSDRTTSKPAFASRSWREQFSDALINWVADGRLATAFAAVAVGVATDAPTAILLPDELLASQGPAVRNAIRRAISLLSLAPLETTRPHELSIPALPAIEGGVLAHADPGPLVGAEWTVDSVENDPATVIPLNTKTYRSATAYISNSYIGVNAGFDIVHYVQQDLFPSKEAALEADAFARIIADDAITQQVTLAADDAVTIAKLRALARSLPDRFDVRKAIFLSRSAFESAEDLADGNGRPLLGRHRDDPDCLELDGVPILKTLSLDALGTADHVVGACISFAGAKLRDVTNPRLTKYSETPNRPDQVGFELFAEHGFGYVPAAVAKLVTPTL